MGVHSLTRRNIHRASQKSARGSSAASVTSGTSIKSASSVRGGLSRRERVRGFFTLLSTRRDLGRDFLREMVAPICNATPVLLPLDLRTVSPGRCVSLTPYGHTSNMGFQCKTCADAWQHNNQETPLPKLDDPAFSKNELCSVTLAFYQQAGKVIQNKLFYLSLLHTSMDAVRASLCQPGLLYSFLVTRAFGKTPFPIFFPHEKHLGVNLIFKDDCLHLHESCLRLLIDNLSDYEISVDSINSSYILKLTPTGNVGKAAVIPMEPICEAVAGLECGDDLKAQFIDCMNIVSCINKKA
ncbi:hypothetical protein RHVP.69 [Cricetid gammaherpesvirus 2]|uniref:Uncharacterized protein n=1 Tax=Cricetid gammaherpesvirus 2 TaxID=1605972 RepID=E9M5Q3_9GAMA|nr:hypothetical protein RHVP.69 [Cricetid gammaherpesvirus 2]ADW24411.1 hypothetical protein RHVP.69 [Cricetid gammaherpesvirus 2]ADW24493.1 hypothetical protein RHVP-L.69 [Cricetid gammaherpesvirus 2]